MHGFPKVLQQQVEYLKCPFPLLGVSGGQTRRISCVSAAMAMPRDRSVPAVFAKECRPAIDRNGSQDAEKAQITTAAPLDPGNTLPRLASPPHPPWQAVRREMRFRRKPRQH